MTPKNRIEIPGGYLCKRYDCTFEDDDLCRRRAEGVINDKSCQLCSGVKNKIRLFSNSKSKKKAA